MSSQQQDFFSSNPLPRVAKIIGMMILGILITLLVFVVTFAILKEKNKSHLRMYPSAIEKYQNEYSTEKNTCRPPAK